jgi:integrase
LVTSETRQETAQREGTIETTDAKTKGLIVQYMSYLEREGYTGSSVYPKLLKILIKKADLQDPEDVKRAIAQQPCKNGTKMLAVYAYGAICRMFRIQWAPPKYTQEEALPFVPDEKELDTLISCCRSRRMATFLQTLKETFADPSEVLRLQWIDLNGSVITINKPVKGHLPGQFEISSKLVAMLNALPKTNQRIFPSNYQTMHACFVEVRKKLR